MNDITMSNSWSFPGMGFFLDRCPNGHQRMALNNGGFICVGDGHQDGDYGSRVIISCNKSNAAGSGRILICPRCRKGKMGETEKLCISCHDAVYWDNFKKNGCPTCRGRRASNIICPTCFNR